MFKWYGLVALTLSLQVSSALSQEPVEIERAEPPRPQLDYPEFTGPENNLSRIDYKTGRFSLDIPLYENLKADLFQNRVTCEQRVSIDGGDGPDGYIYHHSWLAKGLTQTRKNPKGVRADYYPAATFGDLAQLGDPTKVKAPPIQDRSIVVSVEPIISVKKALDQGKMIEVAADTKHYHFSIELKKIFGTNPQTFLSKKVFGIAQVGHGLYGIKPGIPIGGKQKIDFYAPDPLTFNTRNIFREEVGVREFSPTVVLRFTEFIGKAESAKKPGEPQDYRVSTEILCKVCSPMMGNCSFLGTEFSSAARIDSEQGKSKDRVYATYENRFAEKNVEYSAPLE